MNNAKFENQEISIYLDYSTKVQTARKTFLAVKAKLRFMSLRYMLLYLARLKVISGGTECFFDTREDVWYWLEVWEKVLNEQNPAWRNGARKRAMKVSNGRGTRNTSEIAVRQSSERTEIGIVEIQADETRTGWPWASEVMRKLLH
ncbi:hypothetical protein NDU88_005608 [Pleurodeles waltl]|uniref:Uncharacterized protein n=1 Tax=Pleurodeles waltl TaxID=8319 RepID=A0AAV7TAZ0_PLEWA|nr:hypothetical protein NDU88_005608 [Pleurodeles waltl]